MRNLHTRCSATGLLLGSAFWLSLSVNTLLLLLLLLLPGLVNEKTVDISAEGDAVKVRHSSTAAAPQQHSTV
jgi:hypothetical protein